MTAVLPSWHAAALCRTELDPESWFSDNPVLVGMAKAVCGRCEVRDACLRDAVARGEAFGVFGGLSASERFALAGRPLRHGERSTYTAGCHCLPCRRANARYRREHYREAKFAATSRGVLVPIRTLDRPKGRGLHRAFPNQLFLDLGVAA